MDRPVEAPSFACDAMLRGLARWLRAWGYDASWTYGIEDRVLLADALAEGRIVLTADGGVLARRAVREGRPPAIAVAHDAPPLEQLRRLRERLALPRREARCMRCGGPLAEVPKAEVADEAPPRTYAWLDRFFRCGRCGGLFWRGTHWRRIAAALDGVSATGTPDPAPPDRGS